MILVKNISHQAAQKASWNVPAPLLIDRVRVNIGEVAVSADPCSLDALLGSCVSVCLYDPMRRAGSMNHILLPGKSLNGKCTRYGVYAMEVLINELMKHGADRRRLVAKAFGGANVLPGMRQMPVGDHNSKFVREFLATERIPLVAERLGGSHAVLVRFRTDTGKAVVHTVDGSYLPKIAREETSYERVHSADIFQTGEITLF
jgi:chemotaxis protein CheD